MEILKSVEARRLGLGFNSIARRATQMEGVKKGGKLLVNVLR